MDDTDRTTQHRRLHSVGGIVIPCCETGETGCPCVCHDDEQDGARP